MEIENQLRVGLLVLCEVSLFFYLSNKPIIENEGYISKAMWYQIETLIVDK